MKSPLRAETETGYTMDRTGPAPPFGRRSWIRKPSLRAAAELAQVGGIQPLAHTLANGKVAPKAAILSLAFAVSETPGSPSRRTAPGASAPSVAAARAARSRSRSG